MYGPAAPRPGEVHVEEDADDFAPTAKHEARDSWMTRLPSDRVNASSLNIQAKTSFARKSSTFAGLDSSWLNAPDAKATSKLNPSEEWQRNSDEHKQKQVDQWKRSACLLFACC
jgi:hypothetical protein